MKITGTVWVAEKYQSKEKDFTSKGTVAFGKLTWSDKIKGKDGEYTSYTTKSFICFGGNVEVMYACRNDLLEIEGFLKTEKYIDKDGKEQKQEKIFIKSVHVAEKKSAAPRTANNGYQQEEDFNYNY